MILPTRALAIALVARSVVATDVECNGNNQELNRSGDGCNCKADYVLWGDGKTCLPAGRLTQCKPADSTLRARYIGEGIDAMNGADGAMCEFVCAPGYTSATNPSLNDDTGCSCVHPEGSPASCSCNQAGACTASTPVTPVTVTSGHFADGASCTAAASANVAEEQHTWKVTDNCSPYGNGNITNWYYTATLTNNGSACVITVTPYADNTCHTKHLSVFELTADDSCTDYDGLFGHVKVEQLDLSTCTTVKTVMDAMKDAVESNAERVGDLEAEQHWSVQVLQEMDQVYETKDELSSTIEDYAKKADVADQIANKADKTYVTTEIGKAILGTMNEDFVKRELQRWHDQEKHFDMDPDLLDILFKKEESCDDTNKTNDYSKDSEWSCQLSCALDESCAGYKWDNVARCARFKNAANNNTQNPSPCALRWTHQSKPEQTPMEALLIQMQNKYRPTATPTQAPVETRTQIPGER